MNMMYHYLFPGLWMSWAGYWRITAFDVKTVARRESMSSRLLHIIPLLVAALLLTLPNLPLLGLSTRFLPLSASMFWLGATLTCIGLLFAVSARHHLGKNWSGSITVKKDHELITTGLYTVVRHPIYTGLLLALIGTAITIGEWRGLFAVLIAVATIWRKLRLEEQWMQEQFGDVYQDYSYRVNALVPSSLVQFGIYVTFLLGTIIFLCWIF